MKGLVVALMAFASPALADGWEIETLPEDAPVFDGTCLSTYDIPDGNGQILVMASDEAATANIQVGGRLFALHAVSTETGGSESEDGVGRSYDIRFEDADHLVAAEMKTTVTSVNPEFDSTWEEGTLTVTYNGESRTVRIEGGLAC